MMPVLLHAAGSQRGALSDVTGGEVWARATLEAKALRSTSHFILSGEGQAILARHGFEAPAAPR